MSSVEESKLSLIYWTSKLYKRSSKARSIIAATQFSVKTLSKAATSVLKPMYKQINL